MNLALKTELAELKKMGSIACAAGEPILSNPFLVHEACPGVTGESVARWVEKVDAWDSGFIQSLSADQAHLKKSNRQAQ